MPYVQKLSENMEDAKGQNWTSRDEKQCLRYGIRLYNVEEKIR